MPDFSEVMPGYANLWQSVVVTKPHTVEVVANGIIADRARYEPVAKATGVPWFWIAIVHNRESNRDFRGVLHNGQKIIGTGKKTTLVPKGRGPFATWEDAAIDALKLRKLEQVDNWTIPRMLYEFEGYNGWGYFGKINSPYVWAATNHQQPGKYVADHKFDPKHWDNQLGAAAILKALDEMGVVRPAAPADGQKPTPAPNPQQNPFMAFLAALFGVVARLFTKGK
jgi:lysozyme family protein